MQKPMMNRVGVAQPATDLSRAARPARPARFADAATARSMMKKGGAVKKTRGKKII